MDIRFTSSLTPEDENAIAPAVLKALASILDLLPLAYMIRIETSDSQVHQHSRPTDHGPAVDKIGSKSAAAMSFDS